MIRVTTAVSLLAFLALASGRRLRTAEDLTELWNFGNCSSELFGGYTGASPSGLSASGGGGSGGGVASNAVAMPQMAAGAPATRLAAGQPMPAPAMAASAAAGVAADSTLGFRTGGAQDVENFRENIKAGYLPLPTDVTYEGIVKDYYFDTSSPNGSQPCTELFCPIYSVGVAPDPLLGSDNSTQFYMAVGLDSGMKASDFQRKKLNLVLLLDVSGSMGSPFESYYYDATTGRQAQMSPEEQSKTKIEVAKEVLAGIVDKLAPEDSLAVVLFSDAACTPRHLRKLGGDAEELKRRAFTVTAAVALSLLQIRRDVTDTSGTNMQAGLDAATNEMKGCRQCMEAGRADTENRIILITDAQPNQGDTSEEGLLARLKANAADGIYTTIIGVGLDFNSELVEGISKVRGANYYSVHTPGEFQRRLVQDFDYAVTPLVFDLTLSVDPGSLSAAGDNSGWKMLHVYGSPNPNMTALSSNGTVMQVHTLFPSPKTEEGIKGGVVLLRMAPPADGSNRPLQLTVAYTDREGKTFSTKRTVGVPPMASAAADTSAADGASDGSFFGSNGVEKAVLLARYTDLLQDWLLDQWSSVDKKPIIIPVDYCTRLPHDYCPVPVELYGLSSVSGGCQLDHGWLLPDGCLLPPPRPVLLPLLGRWERQSQKLAVGGEARQAIQDFLPYFEAEMSRVGDPSLRQEVDTMNTVLAA